MTKPTILVVTSTLPRWLGDSEPRFVLDLCKFLTGDFRPIVIAPHCRDAAVSECLEGVEVRRYQYLPACCESLAYDGGILPKLRLRPWRWISTPFFFAGLIIAIVRALRQEPVALVHAHWLIPQGVCVRLAMLLSGRSPPLICTSHGADVFGLKAPWARWVQRWVAKGCSTVGAVSHALFDELVRRGVPAEKIRLMPMGVVVPAVPPDPARRETLLIAFAGRLVEKKGVGILLDAFQRLAHAFPGLRLCVAGGGPELEHYGEYTVSLGLQNQVEFLGPVSHERVMALFARANVAVMPSITARDGDSEGLGLVMLEAMAAGCPVVATDLPAVRDVIRPGVNGLLFPEHDAVALAECISELLADRSLATRLAAMGFREVDARFSWLSVARTHQAVYSDAIAAHLRWTR